MNEDPKDALMKKYQQEIEELKKMLEQPEESEEDEGSESGEESEEESDSGDVVIGDTQSHTSGSPQKTGTSPPKSSPEKSTTSSPSKVPGNQEQPNASTKTRKVNNLLSLYTDLV